MASAKKLPSGSWRVRVYDYTDANGKKHYESFTASTKKEAEAMAAQFAYKKDREEKSELKAVFVFDEENKENKEEN